MITKYLQAAYKDGGRGELNKHGQMELDCYGLVRLARAEIYSRRMLEKWAGETRFKAKSRTRDFKEVEKTVKEISEPTAGSFAAVFRKNILIHVALITHDIQMTGDGLQVLEIEPDSNTRIMTISRFLEKNKNRTVRFFDD